MVSKNTSLYTWTYEDIKDRGILWYIIAASILGTLIILGFITQIYGMSIVIIIIASVYLFLENNTQESVHIDIQDHGVWICEKWYQYAHITSFGFVYDHDNVIFLQFLITNQHISTINVRITQEIMQDIEPILATYITKAEKKDVSIWDKILHALQL